MAYATVIKPKNSNLSVIPKQVDLPASEMLPSDCSTLKTEDDPVPFKNERSKTMFDPKSDAMIYQRGSTWTYVIRVPDKEHRGKEKQVWRGGFKTKKEAMDARLREVSELMFGIRKV